jgi:hypothetical protein
MRKDRARKLKNTLLECIAEIEYTTKRAEQDDRSFPGVPSIVCSTRAQIRPTTIV